MNIAHIVEKSVRDGFSVIPEIDAQALLKGYGIACPATEMVTTRDECLLAGERIGFPLVIKVHSRQIVHKSDVGGVIVGIESARQLEQSYDALMRNVAARRSDAVVSGVIVQKQLPKGIEVVVGSMMDRQCGPVVMFGLGGVYVEVFKDVSFRLAPLDRQEALRQIRETKAYTLLSGVRGQPPCNIDKLCDVVVAAGNLLSQNIGISELDFNPVLCYPDECVVVDARFII
jgi:acetate---CoA ligase (ADP-forming) subunit beta